jgi:hypothetical protein
MVLVQPGIDTGCRCILERWVLWANQRSKCALGPTEEVDPFLHQATAEVLSDAAKAALCAVGGVVLEGDCPQYQCGQLEIAVCNGPLGVGG